MKLVLVHESAPTRTLPAEWLGATLRQFNYGCAETVDVLVWDAEQEERLARGETPVFLTISSPRILRVMQALRKIGKPFVLLDHPFAGEQRGHMVRVVVGGIYPPYNPHAPLLQRPRYAWDIQPWRANQPKVLRWCPSAPDEYGAWLGRDQRDQTVPEKFMAAQRRGLISTDWEFVTDLRFKAGEQADAPLRACAEAEILGSAAVCDGNSEKLLHALRLGVPALVWPHEKKPLAHTLASYAPLSLAQLDDPKACRIAREPLFEYLATLQCSLSELIDGKTLRQMVAWQLEHTLHHQP